MKNKIIEGYLKSFIKENGNFGEKSDDIIFEYLVNYLILKKFFIDEFEISDLHTGLGNDLSIDGIAILINDFLATTEEDADYLINTQFKGKDIKIDFVFIQSKTSDKFDIGEVLKFFNGVEEFFDPTGRSYNEKIQNFIKTQNFIYENSSRFSENPNIKLFYTALGKYEKPDDLEAIKQKTINNLNDMALFENISINFFDTKNIMNLYKEAELRISKEIELQRATAFPTAEKIKEAYVSIVPIQDFIQLISDSDGSLIRTLFYENVRDYQGDNPVNKEIINTINSEKQNYFGFFNNGITIVAKNLIKSGEKLNIKDFQIVNGCQTSTILHDNKDKINTKSYITIKIIGTDDNEIINSIIRATNRQTEVKPEAFESLSLFHKQLEEFYNHFQTTEENRIYYERRNKQYVQQDIPKYKIITLATQIKTYLSMFKEQPHSTHRYYGELLKSNKTLFGENDNLYPYFISAYSYYKLDELFRNNKIKNKFKVFRYHIIMMLRQKIQGDYNLPANSKQNESFCKKILDEVDNNLLKYSLEICTTIENIIKNDFKHYDNYKIQRLKDFTNKLLLKTHIIKQKANTSGFRIIKKAKDCKQKV